jgi:hypothetical protein
VVWRGRRDHFGSRIWIAPGDREISPYMPSLIASEVRGRRRILVIARRVSLTVADGYTV